jgi:cell wall-associated NlpC family hydrolase
MYAKYIGIPFEYKGRSPDNKLDCYGLVMLLYKEIHGIDLPDVDSPTFLQEIEEVINSEVLKWTPCELEIGSVLVFSIRGYGAHVGYYIGDDKFIHTWEATNGVTIERFSISWKHRLLGVYKWTKNK